jgi:Protein of unknown function (DUF3604)
MKLIRLSLWILGIAALLIVLLIIYLGQSLSDEGEPWQPDIAAAPTESALPRLPCADNTPLRNAYFGDLHVHTTYSWDGAGRGMKTTPDQAYRFARGEKIGIPPYDAAGNGLRSVQLDRPLDFAAVTDHAESIGEVNLCITPGSERFDTNACRAFRGEEKFGLLPKGMSPMAAIKSSTRSDDLCGEDKALCRNASLEAWTTMQQAAEDWYDRSSDCTFTSFHGYEYTWAPRANRVHRNVIFRNEIVPELPVSAVDEDTPEGLWQSLKNLCLNTDGDCDVLTIPHNPNHSSGMMFPLSDPSDSIESRRERAQLAAELEPLVEMMQIKGESECRNGLWGVTGAPDEFCDLEKWDPLDEATDCEGGTAFGKSFGYGCVSRTDHARYAIAAGLQEQRELGINPYRLGFIGSTDTHNGIPGDVEEWNWEGSTGLSDAKPAKRLKPRIQRNPGGLVGVWAEENSRDALFDAMRSREVFATSGPRMKVRFFASWEDFSAEATTADEQAANWCNRADAIEGGYAEGVPMGGELSGTSGKQASPYFAVHAQRDPGTAEHPGGLLERVQIIKMRALEDGNFHQEVYDVAGGPTGATVDQQTCAPQGAGADQLCTVWQDPDFNAEDSAAYYVRVIENPSCRWTTWTCLSLPAQERPAHCDNPSEAKLTQERAWSSPIWYTPQGSVSNVHMSY